MKNLTKNLNINIFLWLALTLALMGSLKHLAHIFASLDGDHLLGWLQAIAIDTGLFALAYNIKIRKNANRNTLRLWLGITLFSLISIYANYAYGLQAITGQLPTWITTSKPIILAATLPILVLYLSELLSEDHQYLTQQAQKQAQKQAKLEQKQTTQPPITAYLEQAHQARRDKKRTAKQQLLNIIQNNPNITHTQAGQLIGRSKSTVSLYLSELEQDGHITKNGDGWEITENPQ